MTDAITLFNPDALKHLESMAQTLSKSSLIPDALKNKPGDVLVTLMTGAELGLQPMQALRSIAVVKGKPSLSADLMVSLVKQRKDVCEYLILAKSTPEVATYKAKRVGEPEPTEMSFTMQDAQRAGLTGAGGMYAKYPAQMLRARCASGICRAVFPDLCMGLYDSDSGELTDGKPLPEKDITPPRRGLEAIPSVREVKPETELKSLPETTEQSKEPRKPATSSKPHSEWTAEKLSARLDTLNAWKERAAPGNEHRLAVDLELSVIERELEQRSRGETAPPNVDAAHAEPGNSDMELF
jgi:hypothetical protein